MNYNTSISLTCFSISKKFRILNEIFAKSEIWSSKNFRKPEFGKSRVSKMLIFVHFCCMLMLMFLMALIFLTTAIRIFECFRHLLLAKLGNFGHLRFPPEIDICQMVLKLIRSVKKNENSSGEINTRPQILNHFLQKT